MAVQVPTARDYEHSSSHTYEEDFQENFSQQLKKQLKSLITDLVEWSDSDGHFDTVLGVHV